MSELKICRICLRTQTKMFKMNLYGLQWYYQEVLTLMVDDTDRLPQYFCYECATLLHKFHYFKEKCYRGQKILMDLAMAGQITYESIFKVDRKKLKLASSLDIIQNTKVGIIFTLVDKTVIQKNGKRNKKVIHQEKAAVKENTKKQFDIEHISVDQEKPQCKLEKIEIEKNYEIPLTLKEESAVEYSDNDDHYDFCTEDKSTASKVPTNLFIVANKNEDMTIKKLKGRRLKQPNRVTKSKPTKKIAWKFLQILKNGTWKKTTMSEEESLQNFVAKSQNKKYTTATYKCTDCFMFFSNNEIFTRHRQKWHTELNNPFECHICKRRYRHNHQITNHMKSHYNKYECLKCNLVCPLESTVIIHDAFHNGNIKKCEICNEEFRHQSTYYTHIRTAHRSKYLCNLCGRSFVNELGLRQHKLRKHLGAIEKEQLDVNKETSDVSKDVKTYCSMCDIRFETEEAYNEHTLHTSKHNDMIPERQLQRKERRPTECPQCGKVFKSQSACSRHHRNEHSNVGRIPFHGPKRKTVCELCGAIVQNLKLHVMNTHEKRNTCHCNICGMKFSVQAALHRHRLVHTGEKPYKCTLCDKRFTQSGSMKLHYRTFHLKEPYPTRIRKKKFSDLQQALGDIYLDSNK